MTRYIVNHDKLNDFMQNFVQMLRDHGYTEREIQHKIGRFYTNRVIRKYSNEEEDMMWMKVYEIAMSPGGINYLINNMDYMPDFEHRRFKSLKSISKKK